MVAILLNSAQLLENVTAAEHRKIGRTIMDSDFTKEMKTQENLLLGKSKASPGNDDTLNAPQRLSLFQHFEDRARLAGALRLKRKKVEEELALGDVQGLQEILAQLGFSPECRAACLEAAGGDRHIRLDALMAALSEKPAAQSITEVPAAPAEHVANLLETLLYNGGPVEGVSEDVAVRKTGSYSAAEFKEMLERIADKVSRDAAFSEENDDAMRFKGDAGGRTDGRAEEDSSGNTPSPNGPSNPKRSWNTMPNFSKSDESLFGDTKAPEDGEPTAKDPVEWTESEPGLAPEPWTDPPRPRDFKAPKVLAAHADQRPGTSSAESTLNSGDSAALNESAEGAPPSQPQTEGANPVKPNPRAFVETVNTEPPSGASAPEQLEHASVKAADQAKNGLPAAAPTEMEGLGHTHGSRQAQAGERAPLEKSDSPTPPALSASSSGNENTGKQENPSHGHGSPGSLVEAETAGLKGSPSTAEPASGGENPGSGDNLRSGSGFQRALGEIVSLKLDGAGPSPAVNQPSIESRVPFYSSTWPSVVAERFQEMIRQNRHRLTLEVEPKHLGKLVLRVETRNDQVSTWITAEHEQVRELLARNAGFLRQMLAEQGITLGSFSVDVRKEKEHGRFSPDEAKVDPASGAGTASEKKPLSEAVPPATARRLNDGQTISLVA